MRPAPRPISSRIAIVIVAVSMLAGIALRVIWLDRSPPGLNQDEACNGYDAYSILETGRDQHGNFLPLTVQAFNDYRMPIFDYSLIPLIGVLGLKTTTVRLGAAFWGIADIAAITAIGLLTMGWAGAAAAALFAALSPWQLPFSRFAHEAITASATVSLAMMCFFLWLRDRRPSRLLLSGLLFGLSLYSYSITKAFIPLMIGYLGVMYWRDLRRAFRAAAAALALVVLFVIPQVVMLFQRTAQMQARFDQISVFHQPTPLSTRIGVFISSFFSYFSPAFLFIRGDHAIWLHPLGFGQLLPEQALLINVGLLAFLDPRRRKLLVLLLGWLILAALPGALTRGAPHSQHDVLAIAPWILFSALGFVTLLDHLRLDGRIAAAAAALIFAGTVFHGARFIRAYFDDYPIEAARVYHYGMAQVVSEISKLGKDHQPVVITPGNQTYIYVLFFERYPPAAFQRARTAQGTGLFAPVIIFDRYAFLYPQAVYAATPHGIFVYAGNVPLPTPPIFSVRYPDGAVAYNVLAK